MDASVALGAIGASAGPTLLDRLIPDSARRGRENLTFVNDEIHKSVRNAAAILGVSRSIHGSAPPPDVKVAVDDVLRQALAIQTQSIGALSAYAAKHLPAASARPTPGPEASGLGSRVDIRG